MYEALLVIHSMLRWVVFILAIVAIALSYKGWLGKEIWEPSNRKINAAFLGIVHLQIVLGLILYVGVSPIMGPIFADFGAAMKEDVLRFWAVEHITTMILGAIVIHVSFVLAKRAEEDIKKFRRGAIGFTLGFILILAAIPWPWREAVGRGWLPTPWT